MGLLQKISGIPPSWVRFGTTGTGSKTRITCTVEGSRALVMFCIIGVVNTVIDFLIFRGLVSLLSCVAPDEAGRNMWIAGASGASFFIANLFSYFANSHWSFKAETGFGRYVKFAMSSLVGFALAIVVVYVGTEVLGFLPTLAWVVRAVMMPFVNFTLLRLLVFRHPEVGTEANAETHVQGGDKKDGTAESAVKTGN